MTMGPVQMLVIGFDDPQFRGEVLAEIERLRQDDVVRMIDMIVVKKSEDGELETFSQKDVNASAEFGALVGALIGIGAGGEEGAEIGAVRGAEAAVEGGLLDDQEVWYVADAIPNGSAAAIALIEHRWAIGLRDAIGRAGGFHLADAWVHPRDLVAIGLAAAEVADTA
ncbi:MAG: hypothetical protein ACRDQE_14460 [Gaiellales bacterium]